MRSDELKAKLKLGEVVIGTMVFEFSSPGLPTILANAGAQFAVFDMEHSGFTIDTVRNLVANSRGAGLVPMVRVPAGEYHFIARALDVGAKGVMVPMVETAEQADSIVKSAKYWPHGRRGTAFGIAHDDFLGGDVVEKMRRANEETIVIALIETERGVENVEAILSVEGVDVGWVGHFDLTQSMGIPGQFAHPRFQEAMDRVLLACVRTGVAPGFMVTDIASGLEWIERGVRCVAYYGDIWLLNRALGEGIAGLRQGQR